jgi:hypothetical protein
MSSDDTDDESNEPQYRIMVKPWRSVAVTVWLRTFDAIYRYDQRGPACPSRSRGNQARRRFESNIKDDSSPAIRRLPRNAYDEGWLARLNTYDLETIDPVEEPYDFTHTAGIQLLVLCAVVYKKKTLIFFYSDRTAQSFTGDGNNISRHYV